MKLTRQGVADLNYVGPAVGEKVTIVDYEAASGITRGLVLHVRCHPDRFDLWTGGSVGSVPVVRGINIRVADRHLWARGWDTPEAKALAVSEALR